MPFIVSKDFYEKCLKEGRAVEVNGKYYIFGLGEVIFNQKIKVRN